MRVEVVENPDKRRGGGRKRHSRRRRRNPGLALMAGNPHRRRRARRASSYHSVRRYRRRSNPDFMAGIDIQSAAWVAGGMIGANLIPGLIAKVWPAIPRAGIAGHAVKVGGVIVMGFLARMLTKSPARSNQLVAGGLALVLYDVYNEYLAPKLGLTGMGGFVTTDEINQIVGVNGFVNRNLNLNGIGQYVDDQRGELITG